MILSIQVHGKDYVRTLKILVSGVREKVVRVKHVDCATPTSWSCLYIIVLKFL
jgi:hypothetical protein